MKNFWSFWKLSAATVLLLAAGIAQAEDACTAPGLLVLDDPAGDVGSSPQGAATVPVPEPSFDIRSLHMAEPADLPGKLVFTYKIESLATLLPNIGYVLRLSTDFPPAAPEDDYMVAMITGPDATPSFVYGTTGFVDPAPPRFVNIDGTLDPSSNYAADGTITLVLDKAAIPGLEPGLAVFNILPSVRLLTPTAGAADTATNGDNATIVDDAAGSGFYDLLGNESCAGKSGILGAGALPLSLLLPFGFAALRARRRPSRGAA